MQPEALSFPQGLSGATNVALLCVFEQLDRMCYCPFQIFSQILFVGIFYRIYLKTIITCPHVVIDSCNLPSCSCMALKRSTANLTPENL